MVRIGVVGVGFMGMIHYLAARKLQGARVTAICSRDAKKLAGDWRGIRGNFGPPGQKMDLLAPTSKNALWLCTTWTLPGSRPRSNNAKAASTITAARNSGRWAGGGRRSVASCSAPARVLRTEDK